LLNNFRIQMPVIVRSVLDNLNGTGATLPTAMRISSNTPLLDFASPAMHTFEIACAFRAPTLRE
jgi:hypothetical protein